MTSFKPAMPTAVQRPDSAALETTTYQPRKAWAIAAGLAVFAAINFLDKVVLGMLAVPIMQEMGLTPTQFGVIAGSFFWLFSLSAVIVGFIGNRIATRWLLLAMAVMWSLIQLPIALASSAAVLLAARVILGVCEGPGFPISVHALYKWFPHEKRNLPVSVINQGAVVGLLLAGLAVPLITHEWGWRANFVVLAAASALWAVGWFFFGAEGKLKTEMQPAGAASCPERIAYRRLLTDPTLLSNYILGFAAYWGLALTLTWLPSYLEKGLGFSAITTGRLFAVIVAVGIPIGLALSWGSQQMLRKGMSSRWARAVFVSILVVAGGLLLLLLPLPGLSSGVKVALLAAAGTLPTLAFAINTAILAEITPDAQRSAIIAMGNAFATSAGVIAPVIMGHLIQIQLPGNSAHGYELGYALGGVVMVVGGLIGLFGQNPVRSIRRLWG